MSDKWEEYSNKFDNTDEKLGRVFEEVNSQIERSVTQMQDFVNKVDSQFANGINALSETIRDLDDSIISELGDRLGKSDAANEVANEPEE